MQKIGDDIMIKNFLMGIILSLIGVLSLIILLPLIIVISMIFVVFGSAFIVFIFLFEIIKYIVCSVYTVILRRDDI